MVRLRFHRLACRNRPFYRVVAADRQDGGKRMGLEFDRIKWTRDSHPVDPLTGCFVTPVEHTNTDLPKSSQSLNIATLFDN
ncbi:hypothetical protein MKW92_024344 [Papaver armeniacum]|nr:hypothetical protein MKW92_024344 [Papaver armeniacum]